MENVSEKVDGFDKVMKQIPITFRKIAKDIDEVEDKVEENKQNTNREILFKEMNGNGIYLEMNKFYKKVMEENPKLVEDIRELKLDNYMIGEHENFKEELKEMDKLKEDLSEIEECFINAMEI